ncbi:MAG TPA: MarC family protein [Nitrospinota bacterium]|nr:MarC family protein [Nitrospinota bacterium]
MDLVNVLILTFIPIFVAVDIVGIIPIFLSFVDELDIKTRNKIIWQSIITATVVSLAFAFLGKGIFIILGVTVADFKIAGGLILLVLAVIDIIFPEKKRREPGSTVGVVPIGMPLIVGPAVITTIIILVDIYGVIITTISLILNLLIACIALYSSNMIINLIGEGGLKATSKVVSLLLAAIGVMMIRLGIIEIINKV